MKKNLMVGVIPARYASTRFPGKPLIDIGGKSMIQRVYEQAKQARSLSAVVVATDDQRIFDHVKGFGGEVVMTAEQHQSGTDRCFEAIQNFMPDAAVVVNIQGDEPFIHPESIEQVCSCFNDFQTEIATLVKLVQTDEELFNANTPKVILNVRKEAIYFSRHTIPHLRNKKQEVWLNSHPYYKHIGIYAYRTDILKQITALPQSALELAESLEQLRWIENGYKIKTEVTDFESVAVDSPSDLQKLTKFL